MAGLEVMTSAVLGEDWDGGEEESEELEPYSSSGLREGVIVGGDGLDSGWKEVLARILAESWTPIAEELDVMVVAAELPILASVFSSNIFLARKALKWLLVLVRCRKFDYLDLN